jgi:hypothetical protein
VLKGWTYALWQGRLDTLGAVLERIPADVDLGGGIGARIIAALDSAMFEACNTCDLDRLATYFEEDLSARAGQVRDPLAADG